MARPIFHEEIDPQRGSKQRSSLSAIAGFLFDVGSGRFTPSPRCRRLSALSKARETAKRLEGPIEVARENALTHTEFQAWLRDLGLSLGYKIWIAADDRGRAHDGATLAAGCLDHLPPFVEDAASAESIRLIDALWIDGASSCVSAAFEVEPTFIYSGIVRMLDLALSRDLHARGGLFLVAPDGREEEVRN